MIHTKISKAISKFLRHSPEEIGLTLEEGGWVKVLDLIRGLNKKGLTISFDELEELVNTNDKKRFTFNENKTKIRAAQGHSVEVDLKLEPSEPPQYLYHGTNARVVDDIYREGIKPMSRQQVHLSTNVETATRTGARQGKPRVLIVASFEMYVDGYHFYQADNGVWLTDFVPRKYIRG